MRRVWGASDKKLSSKARNLMTQHSSEATCFDDMGTPVAPLFSELGDVFLQENMDGYTLRVEFEELPGDVVTFVSGAGSALGAQPVRCRTTGSAGVRECSFDAEGAYDGASLRLQVRRHGLVFDSAVAFVRVSPTAVDATFSREPEDARTPAGQPASFSAKAEAAGPVTYLWYRDDELVQAGPGPTLSLSTTAADEGKEFSVRVDVAYSVGLKLQESVLEGAEDLAAVPPAAGVDRIDTDTAENLVTPELPRQVEIESPRRTSAMAAVPVAGRAQQMQRLPRTLHGAPVTLTVTAPTVMVNAVQGARLPAPSGAELILPAGALAADASVTITLEDLPADLLPVGFKPVSPIYRLDTGGVALAMPAELRVALPQIPPNLAIAWLDLEALATSPLREARTGSGRLVACGEPLACANPQNTDARGLQRLALQSASSWVAVQVRRSSCATMEPRTFIPYGTPSTETS